MVASILLAQVGALNTAALGALAWVHMKRHDFAFFPGVTSFMASPVTTLALALYSLWLVAVGAVLLKALLLGEGPLRAIEWAHLREYSWLTVSEFLLSMATFRDDFSAGFVIKFAALMALKCAHWLARDRTDWQEEMPETLPGWYHVRMPALLASLATIDASGAILCIDELVRTGPSANLLFASEFVVMFFAVCAVGCRHALNENDRLRREEGLQGWDRRSSLLFQCDLITDVCKLATTLIFLAVIVRYYGFPLHMFREIVVTAVSLGKRVNDALRYHKAMAELDRRFPDIVHADDLAALNIDATCIICREEMSVGGGTRLKRLYCGHVFHMHCLQSWMERQQVCPTCRHDVFTPMPPPPSTPPAANPLDADLRATPSLLTPPAHFNSGLRDLSDPQELDRLAQDLDQLVESDGSDDIGPREGVQEELRLAKEAIQRLKRSILSASASPVADRPAMADNATDGEEGDWTTDEE